MNKIINKLIALGNSLDESGFFKEADIIDFVITASAKVPNIILGRYNSPTSHRVHYFGVHWNGENGVCYLKGDDGRWNSVQVKNNIVQTKDGCSKTDAVNFALHFFVDSLKQQGIEVGYCNTIAPTHGPIRHRHPKRKEREDLAQQLQKWDVDHSNFIKQKHQIGI